MSGRTYLKGTESKPLVSCNIAPFPMAGPGIGAAADGNKHSPCASECRIYKELVKFSMRPPDIAYYTSGIAAAIASSWTEAK